MHPRYFHHRTNGHTSCLKKIHKKSVCAMNVKEIARHNPILGRHWVELRILLFEIFFFRKVILAAKWRHSDNMRRQTVDHVLPPISGALICEPRDRTSKESKKLPLH